MGTWKNNIPAKGNRRGQCGRYRRNMGRVAPFSVFLLGSTLLGLTASLTQMEYHTNALEPFVLPQMPGVLELSFQLSIL